MRGGEYRESGEEERFAAVRLEVGLFAVREKVSRDERKRRLPARAPYLMAFRSSSWTVTGNYAP